MSQENIMIIPLILSLQLTFQTPITKANDSGCISVEGYAKVMTGNQMPGNRSASAPLKNKSIIAVLGHVKAEEGKPSIPIKSISSKIIETRTDKKGIFRFSLLPGFYTFFIVNEEKAYLNRYDGNGFFLKGQK